LSGGCKQDKVTLAVVNRRGCARHCRVNLAPLLTAEEDIIGVIMMMVEQGAVPDESR